MPKIVDKIVPGKPFYSFEYFPPKATSGKACKSASHLRQFPPHLEKEREKGTGRLCFLER